MLSGALVHCTHLRDYGKALFQDNQGRSDFIYFSKHRVKTLLLRKGSKIKRRQCGAERHTVNCGVESLEAQRQPNPLAAIFLRAQLHCLIKEPAGLQT